MPLLRPCQIYMTASAWGSWLITTFLSRRSAGTMTAQSMWVSCNQYMGVLDSLYSADSIHRASIYYNKEVGQQGNAQMQRKQTLHPFFCTHSGKHFGIFQRDQVQQ